MIKQEIKIRKMKISDISEIIKIGKTIKEFEVDTNLKGYFWSEEQLNRWINSQKDVLIIAEEEKKIVGFVMFAHHVPTGKATFENAWVDEKLRGGGIIEELVKNGIKDLKKKGVTYICALTKTDNMASIKSFKKNKFRKGYDFSWLHRKI